MKYLIALLLLSFPAFAAEPVNIALVGPMTGSLAAFGEQMRHGAELAVADINAQGGLKGQPINLIVEDDACDPKQAVAVASRIVSRSIKYVIGHWCSGTTMAAQQIYAEDGILQIDPAGLLPEETQQGMKTFFRVSSTADYWGKITANYSLAQDKPKRAFIMSDSRAVTKVFGSAIAAELKAKNPAIEIAQETFQAGDKDFQALVQRAKSFKPDVIFLSSYTLEGALIVRQAQTIDAAKKYYGFDTLGSPDFAKTIGMEKADQVVFIDYARPQGSAALASVNTRLNQKNWPKETYTYMLYGILELMQQAAAQAENLQPATMARTLSTGHYKTILGDLSFTPQGDNKIIKFAAYRWRDNKIQAIGSAN